MRNLFLFIAAMSLHANAATDSRLDHQKGLSQMGDKTGRPLKGIRSEGKDLLAAARGEADGISQQDYNFLKGTSAFAASGAEWAHLEGINGNGVKILLLEDSGINHADIRGIVDSDSQKDPATGMKYKLDHGSSMASLIHALAPASNIRVRPIANVTDAASLTDVRIINASFGSNERNGFANSFPALTAANNVLIAKSAGNHQENLSEHPHTQGCESLLPFTIFAGNLRQDYKGKTSSGFPGENTAFQNSFIWVIADDVMAASGADGSTEYSPGSGTSNAAAILSGAAALILSKYPTLTTAELKDVLLESADRDIFQTFGSGYKALHIVDSSVDFNRKFTQYKKMHPQKLFLDFAEDLADSGDYTLAAEIIAGLKGAHKIPEVGTDREQYKRIVRRLDATERSKLESLAVDSTTTLSERTHRESIQQILAEIDINIAETSHTPVATQRPTTTGFNKAFWGKGILNIKNALIYADLKIKNPKMSAHSLRERMLELINNAEQKAAADIQRIVRGRLINRSVKPTEKELAERPGLAINTTLPGRNFTKMDIDPNEPVVPDQSDEERLRGLGITLPEAPSGKQLKFISDGTSTSATSSGPAREITPIDNSDIPAGASAELKEFLKADQEALFGTFTKFGRSKIIPLLDLSPEEAANKLIQFYQSLGQFKANRVINLGHNSSGISIGNSFWNNKIASTSVTIIDLFHDAVRNQIIIDQSNGKYDINSQKIGEIAIQLFEKLKSQGLMNNSLLPSILSLLKDYRTSTLNNFIINNDLLDTKFTHIASLYDYASETYKLSTESLIGADILGIWELKDLIDNTPSTQITEKIKSFFKKPKGREFFAQISMQYIQNAFFKIYNEAPSMWEKTEQEQDARSQETVVQIFGNIQASAPKLFDFIQNYAEKSGEALHLAAMTKSVDEPFFELPPSVKPLIKHRLNELSSIFR